MPIWTEILAFSLASYVLGLGVGWVIWGRNMLAAPNNSNTLNHE